ncbi:MAG TPA: sugar transferase [Candidatus Paceibacterota bacterium]
MRSIRTREVLTLFFGDLILLYASLWLTLAIRYVAVPNRELLDLHLVPFSLLFAAWLLLFFIVGMYDRHTLVFRMRLPDKILRVQLANMGLAVIFFFFIPIFGIAPKTNLFIYLVVSSALLTFWRLWLYPRISWHNRQPAIIVGASSELRELELEINSNARYPFYFTTKIVIERVEGGAISGRIFDALQDPSLAFVVIDLHHRKLANILPHLYKPIFSNVQFIDLHELYAEIFERLPLSILGEPFAVEGFGEKASHWVYDALKRVIDIFGALAMGVITLVVTPFVWIAMRLEGPGPVFIVQERIGRNGTTVRTLKFRSMRVNDATSASWVGEYKENGITKTGAFLRRFSLDEFPQCVNVLRGDLSLIGPRSDIEGLGKRLAEKIPFYNMRYRVKPGITGWAQINQQYEPGQISPQSVEDTKVRLAYDFFYIKNRSLILDLIIALKTLKRMVFRMSSW